MTQRFYVYPLLLMAALLLVPLLRHDRRWYAAQITQLSLILLASLGAVFFSEDRIWVVIAWSLVGAFIIVPGLLLRLSSRQQYMGRWSLAARSTHWAGRFAWGHLGKLHRAHAVALALQGRGARVEALAVLDELPSRPMPVARRGEVRLWKLSLLAMNRDWPGAVAFYEQVDEWGTLAVATQARLHVARAFAEVGDFERALRSLQFVVLSPRTIAGLATQLWLTRVSVAALAGDRSGLDELMQDRRAAKVTRQLRQFEPYWRGRCELIRGEFAEAVKLLARAHSLTNPKLQQWRDAIAEHLRQAESGGSVPSFAAHTEAYTHGQVVLHSADLQAMRWRDLMSWGRPDWGTLTILLPMVAVFVLTNFILGSEVAENVLTKAGNIPTMVFTGEWWRLVTALFLHGNTLHLLMNSLTLLIFGSAVERTLGWWRLFLIFIVAGIAGNFLSATLAHYELSVGASTGIFGLIGAFTVEVYRLRSPIYTAQRRRLLMLLALMVAADFSIGAAEPTLDNFAHVGGFFAGLFLTFLLDGRGTRAAATSRSP